MLVVAFCLALFAVMRLLAATGDFYVDEIWSFFFARQFSSPLDALRLNHDNNHVLNTLYLYFLGGKPFVFAGKPTFIPHRLLSVITGTASVWLLWKIASERGRAEGLTALFLAGMSFPLILYSSEARGYGLETMFALASFLLARKYMDGKGAWMAVLFWAASILAFLSHSSYVFIYLGLLLWTFAEVIRSRKGRPLGRLLFVHLVPMVFLVFYYLFFLKSMVYGGGEVEGVFKVVSETASMALGLPSGGLSGYMSLAAVVGLSASGLYILRGSSEPVFFVSALFIVPALTTSTIKPEFLYFRYFLVCFPFFYLLAAYALSGLCRRSSWGRPLFFAIMAAYAVLNVNLTVGLIMEGRGSYYDAVGHMAAGSPGPEIVVGGDHDFRNKLVLDFYSRYFPGRKITYLDRVSRRERTPEWLLGHSVDSSRRPPRYQFDSGVRFTLERSYGFSGVSGWSWHVYRRDEESG